MFSPEYFRSILTKYSPITTYGGQGTRKPGVDPFKHAIVYTGNKPPGPLLGEIEFFRDPLRVICDDPEAQLSFLSRINCAKVFPINLNVKVKEIGQLDQQSRSYFLEYIREFLGSRFAMEN